MAKKSTSKKASAKKPAAKRTRSRKKPVTLSAQVVSMEVLPPHSSVFDSIYAGVKKIGGKIWENREEIAKVVATIALEVIVARVAAPKSTRRR